MNFVESLSSRIVVCMFEPMETVTMPFVVRGGGKFQWNQKECDLSLNTQFNTYCVTLDKSISLSNILTPIKMEKVVCVLWFDMEVKHTCDKCWQYSISPLSHCFLIGTHVLKVSAKNHEMNWVRIPGPNSPWKKEK